MESKKYWYAVQFDRDDDLGTGSFNLDESIAIANRNSAEIIAVIDANYNDDGEATSDYICVEELTRGVDF